MNKGIRQFHRWMSAIFTLFAIGNFVLAKFGMLPNWLLYLPALPLFLLFFSGLYMFALPYAARWRRARA
jgi:hypothetical protein